MQLLAYFIFPIDPLTLWARQLPRMMGIYLGRDCGGNIIYPLGYVYFHPIMEMYGFQSLFTPRYIILANN